jgi:Flp pilus assembly protein TadB
MKKEHGFAWLAGMVVLIGVVVLVGFVIWSRAIYAFGLFGAFLVLAVALLIFGWVYDRRLDKRYPDESA